jgi:hypothetical protein
MITRILFSMAVVLSFLFAQVAVSQEMSSNVKDEPVKVDVDNFKEMAPGMIGKSVEISGMVTHVCKHGGKKMFIMHSDADVQVKITTGEDIAAFPAELEGSTVWVSGIVEEMMVEVVEEEEGEHEEDEAHKNIYHKPQYSIACAKYQVTEK